jgi:predicted translation initiation factor SUI1
MDRAQAQAAAAAFATVAQRLGLAWRVCLGTPSELPDKVAVTVCVDDTRLPLVNRPGRIERFASANLGDEVNKLIARLLGGNDSAILPPAVSPPPKIHTVKVSRESAGRRGKGVTVVSDLPLTEEQLKELATKLKTACGSGGTAKAGRIEIQGDHRDKLVSELEKLGYKVKRAGG